MRIGSHYGSPARRLLPALLALVYIGALSGGLLVHMVDEGAELRALAAAMDERHPGEPLPRGGDVPDDLDCLLCQVLGTPGHPGPEASSVAAGTSAGTLGHPPGEPTRDALPRTRQARAPPLA